MPRTMEGVHEAYGGTGHADYPRPGCRLCRKERPEEANRRGLEIMRRNNTARYKRRKMHRSEGAD